jgi:glucose-6-phosphate dehydrogenase assembly protein OpcA
MRLALDQVERELGRLWDAETRNAGSARVGLQTLVALVSEPGLLDRAERVVADVACVHPSRTIVAVWKSGGAPAITGDVALHRPREGGAACGDAITFEAIGDARDWIPGNAERLSLPDLPVFVWWVGDLPDFDDLFDRMVVGADLVVVNSQEMDLRDLEKLSSIAMRSQRRYALADLTWVRLRWLQDLVARFFDDEAGRAWLPKVQRVIIEYSPRPGETDATSTRAALLFGWIANALGLRGEGGEWKRGEGWSEVRLGEIVARFEQRLRPSVRPGGIVRVAIECPGARFQVERLEDPQTFRWSRELPDVPTPPHVLHVQSVDESTLLLQCLERPARDGLLETSLHVASLIVRPVAPRLSTLPARP